MKITIKATSFIASLGEVGIARTDFDISRVLAIINQTKGILIYSTANPTLKYTSYDLINKKVVVSYDTSLMSDSDIIQVVYEAEDSPASSIAESQTQTVGTVSPTLFTAPAGVRTMQIFNNPALNSAPIRWTPSWETPSASNGAMLVPTSPALIIPAGNINVIAVDEDADVTVVYYN